MSNEYGSRAERRRASKEEKAVENNKQIEQQNEPTTVRTERVSRAELRKNSAEAEKETFVGNSWPSYGIIALIALALSVTFYTFPLFHQQATPLQSQYLYSGFAMQHGLTPFNDFFGAGGSVFYLLNWLGNLTAGTLILYLLEVIALFASGVLTYRLVLQQTAKSSAATIVSAFTMIIVAGLGRGGDVPTLFALPFVIWAVKFLDAYFNKDNKDEKFILFGMAAAFVFVISPLMSVFFAFSALALFFYNVTHRHVSRGIYQLLGALFGLLVIGYSIAYYALNAQTIYTSIEQSVLIPFTHFGMTGNVLLTLAKALILLLVFGLLIGLVQGFMQLKNAGQATIWYVFLLIGAILVAGVVIFTPFFDSSNLLAVLPFILVFQGRGLENAIKEDQNLLFAYLQSKGFTPILALIFVVGAPIAYSMINQTTFANEKSVAQYIRQNTSSKDHVYVLSADKNINLLAQRTAGIDTVPANYPLKFSQTYDLNIGNIKDKYIVIEAGQKVPNSLNSLLTANYKAVGFDGNNFKIFQRK